MRTVDAAGLSIGDESPPRIMGVLNVSSESPYDPSVYSDPGLAAEYVDEDLIDEGADIVDIGLESANKRLDVLSAEEELERLDTAVETIQSVSGDAVFSIETRYAEVARAALDRGFDMVNDICGFADPEMPAVCREYDVAVCAMASPPDLGRPGAVDDVDWADERSEEWAEQATYVDRIYAALAEADLTEKTIIDPAFGGWSEDKTVAHDRETFHRLREFRGLGHPMLVSINRKNFLRSIADRSTEEALPVSLAATSMAVERGAHVIRTHDVAETRDAALVGHEFTDRSRVESESICVQELDTAHPGDVTRHLDRLGVSDVSPASLASRVLEVSGLDSHQRATLNSATEETDAVLASAGDSLLLGGSEATLDRLADALADDPSLDPLADALAMDRTPPRRNDGLRTGTRRDAARPDRPDAGRSTE